MSRDRDTPIGGWSVEPEPDNFRVPPPQTGDTSGPFTYVEGYGWTLETIEEITGQPTPDWAKQTGDDNGKR